MDPLFPRIEALLADSKKADKVDKQRALLFTKLTASPEWKAYVELLNAMVQRHADLVLSRAGSVDGAIALEYVKGAMSGLLLARDMPGSIVEAMKGSTSGDGDDE